MKAKETKIRQLVQVASQMFPEATCELKFRNVYELSVAVILSAQTTDPAVNKVTPKLFEMFPDAFHLANSDLLYLETLIKSIGLYHTKAKHLQALAKILVEKFNGEIPSDFDVLTTLPGIGRKTANVIVSVGFNQPGLAVDTHVLRVSQRFGIVAKDADPLKTEMTLKKSLPPNEWGLAHHAILFFGRYHCTARHPKCDTCTLKNDCRYKKTNL